MSWERGAWEKKTSQGASYGTEKSGHYISETVNNPGYPRTTVSEGIRFCPNCGSMMLPNRGYYRCNSCGYSESSFETQDNIVQRNYEEEKRERIRIQMENEQKTRNQMDDVLRFMRQGKSRAQAASAADVPLSRVTHWFNEGKSRCGTDNIRFYREVKSIEDDRERIKRQEKAKRERIERERRQRKSLERNIKTSKFDYSGARDQMKKVISAMRNGKSKHQAVTQAGITIKQFNQWYNLGEKGLGTDNIYFYNEISKLNKKSTTSAKNNTTNKSKSKSRTAPTKTSNTKTNYPKFVRCPKCGNWHRPNIQCSKCNPSKSKSTSLTKVNYCQNCGKKITTGDLNYCSECGSSIKDDKKSKNKIKSATVSKSTPEKSDSSDWAKCCGGIIVIFLIIAILRLLF